MPGLAKETAVKVATVCNLLERILPKVAVGKLVDLNDDAISRFQAALRDGGRAESTIASYLGHLRAMLAWGHDLGMLPIMPKIRRPKRAQKGSKGRKSKGRPITAEELDRMMGKIPAALAEWRKRQREAVRKTRRNKGASPHKAAAEVAPMEVSPAAVESWRHFLNGLWLSGLRRGESLSLVWDRRPDRPCIDMDGRRPMLRIPAACEKGNRERVLPITPDFAEFITRTSEADRHGPAFRPLMPSGNPATAEQAGRMVALIGELARVVVHTDPKTGGGQIRQLPRLATGFRQQVGQAGDAGRTAKADASRIHRNDDGLLRGPGRRRTWRKTCIGPTGRKKAAKEVPF